MEREYVVRLFAVFQRVETCAAFFPLNPLNSRQDARAPFSGMASTFVLAQPTPELHNQSSESRSFTDTVGHHEHFDIPHSPRR